MPIVVSGQIETTTVASVDSGQISFLRAKQIVARTIGDSADQALLDEAGDLVLMALEELSLKQWEFMLRTTSLSFSASTNDIQLPPLFKKVYTIKWSSTSTGSTSPLQYVRERGYRKATATQTTGSPSHYTLFGGDLVEDAEPQHSIQTIRLIPTPQQAGTVSLQYYRQIAIVDDDGDTLDLPRRYQYWPIYQAKAWILADHDGSDARIGYWQGRADRLMTMMVSDDQEEPDENLGFESARDQLGPYDITHPQAALYALDGF